MKISLCSTCMGRTHHLKKTLPSNMMGNWTTVHEMEYIVLNYNSSDDLDEWIATIPNRKRVRYFTTREPQYFHMSHAKNIAHRAATGDVLCNVDADVYWSEGRIFEVAGHFKRNPNIILHFFPGACEGSPEKFDWQAAEGAPCGTICISRENFYKLGGYDEAMGPMIYQDWDLLLRAKAMGLEYVPVTNMRGCGFIPHGLREKFRNCQNYEENKGRLGRYHRQKQRAHKRIAAEREGFVANVGHDFGHVNDLVEVKR